MNVSTSPEMTVPHNESSGFFIVFSLGWKCPRHYFPNRAKAQCHGASDQVLHGSRFDENGLDTRRAAGDLPTASDARRRRRPIIVETLRDGAYAAAVAAASSSGGSTRVQAQAPAPRGHRVVARR